MSKEQDEQHLSLLSIFHFIVGGMTGLFSCLPIFHLAFGIAIICGALDSAGGTKDHIPHFIGWFLALFALVFILIGWSLTITIISAGLKLKRRKNWLYCMIIAGIECVMFPFGTVLGVFTIIVLMRDSVKMLFQPCETGDESQFKS